MSEFWDESQKIFFGGPNPVPSVLEPEKQSKIVYSLHSKNKN